MIKDRILAINMYRKIKDRVKEEIKRFNDLEILTVKEF
jgi:hypothetical protein